jgi:hypothetical protein
MLGQYPAIHTTTVLPDLCQQVRSVTKRAINDMGAIERQYESEMSMNIDPEMLLQTVARGSSRTRAYVFRRIGNAKCLSEG